MNKTQAGRMLTMAAFVKKLPPHNLMQGYWVDLHSEEAFDDLLNPQCKSSCCALGWTAVLNPREWHVRVYEDGCVLMMHRRSGSYNHYGACEYFGISMDEAGEVFGSTQRTPAEQAKIMRKLVDKYGWEEA